MQPVDLKIIEANGWSKSVKLIKSITLVGSSAGCDIVLNSNQITPVHAQILCSTDLPTGCRLVNFAAPIRIHSMGADLSIDPFSARDIQQEDELVLGDYRIVFDLPLSTEFVQKTSSMEAALSFSNAVLRPEYPLEGKLVVKNLGKGGGTQVQVELKGLPPDCYLIDPIPLLYSGAQEEIRVRLFHKTLYPEAGIQSIFLVVTAPNSYPGEELSIQQKIYVAPVFDQKLEVQDDIAEEEALQRQKAATAAALAVETLVQPEIPAPNENATSEPSANTAQKETLPGPARPPVEATVEERGRAAVEEDPRSTPLPDWSPQQAPVEEVQQVSSAKEQDETIPFPEWTFIKVTEGSTRAADPIETGLSHAAGIESFQTVQAPEPTRNSVIPAEKAAESSLVDVATAQVPVEPVPAVPGPAPRPEPVRIVAAPANLEEEDDFPEKTLANPVPSKPNVDRSKLKVMRHPSKEFWNED